MSLFIDINEPRRHQKDHDSNTKVLKIISLSSSTTMIHFKQ